ncbi:MAG TPA: hypothetical protein VK505_04905, partial [Steroidobacteraceae bacterium]|nr:hypothetical protein [Steroidobacteraceae bacterium]
AAVRAERAPRPRHCVEKYEHDPSTCRCGSKHEWAVWDRGRYDHNPKMFVCRSWGRDDCDRIAAALNAAEAAK